MSIISKENVEMKKKILFVIFMFFVSFVYSEEVLNISHLKELISSNASSDMFSFTEKEKPFYIEFERVSNKVFLNRNMFALSESIFPDAESITLDNIKNHLMKKENIFSVNNGFIIYDWLSTDDAEISVQYTQTDYGVIHGCGVFVIRVFWGNYVYTIRLYDQKYCYRYDKYFHSKGEFFVFREGKEPNPAEGIEGDQGYYCKDKNSAELFYKFMCNCTDKDDYACQFYKVYEAIIKSIINI